ncbi:MAG TPA: YggS family pyridoxal phosphate-dependent enzyme [Myxococcota bacterium]|nr:YggS family pyridoxal phosphate-dependent enzyme [Myxococcota bacterium]
MSELAARLAELRGRIAESARGAGRDPADVALVAVTKTVALERVREAIALGLRRFGENRVQEAESKIEALAQTSRDPLEWHLIGSLQRNKVRRAVALCDVIQSVDRPELIESLAREAAAQGRRPGIFLQVNIDAEPQKGGCAPDALAELARQVEAAPQLRLLGLMAIPRACEHPEEVRPSFARLRGLLAELNRARGERAPLRELSIGMSSDFEVAVQEGATCVRVGTALFGEREKP